MYRIFSSIYIDTADGFSVYGDFVAVVTLSANRSIENTVDGFSVYGGMITEL
jgi:hypothetical protein